MRSMHLFLIELYFRFYFIHKFITTSGNIFFMLFLTAAAVAQTENATISVGGNCTLCKARIEKAAKNTKVIKYAVWQANTTMLNLHYNAKKTNKSQVSTHTTGLEHQANGVLSPIEMYNALPLCCQYLKRKIMVIGHRGAMGHAPENTLPSIRAALKLGVDAIEIDVFRIASGELIVFHDETLDKLTNGNGAIEGKTYNQLSKLTVLGTAKIPTLKEVLLEINGAVSLNVELKGANTAKGTVELFDDFVSKGIFTAKQLYVSSFNWNELRDFREFSKTYDIALLTDNNPLSAVGVANELQAIAINPNFYQLNANLIHTLQANGFKVIPYTVNDPKDIAALIEMGVNGIITDYPDRIVD